MIATLSILPVSCGSTRAPCSAMSQLSIYSVLTERPVNPERENGRSCWTLCRAVQGGRRCLACDALQAAAAANCRSAVAMKSLWHPAAARWQTPSMQQRRPQAASNRCRFRRHPCCMGASHGNTGTHWRWRTWETACGRCGGVATGAQAGDGRLAASVACADTRPPPPLPPPERSSTRVGTTSPRPAP